METATDFSRVKKRLKDGPAIANQLDRSVLEMGIAVTKQKLHRKRNILLDAVFLCG